jgi:hypothetical protein
MQEEGWLVANTLLDPRRTLYASIGDLFPWMCLTVTAAALALAWFYGRKLEG